MPRRAGSGSALGCGKGSRGLGAAVGTRGGGVPPSSPPEWGHTGPRSRLPPSPSCGVVCRGSGWARLECSCLAYPSRRFLAPRFQPRSPVRGLRRLPGLPAQAPAGRWQGAAPGAPPGRQGALPQQEWWWLAGGVQAAARCPPVPPGSSEGPSRCPWGVWTPCPKRCP